MPSTNVPHLSVLDASLDQKEDVILEEHVLEISEGPSTAEITHVDRKILLTFDLLVLPPVCVIYLLSYLDKANIGNARVVSRLEISAIFSNHLLIYRLGWALEGHWFERLAIQNGCHHHLRPLHTGRDPVQSLSEEVWP